MNSNSDSIAQSDWCEVPLGTHGEQEVRHRSRYRKNGQTFSEQESVKSNGSENDVISTASGLMAGTGLLVCDYITNDVTILKRAVS